MRFPKTLAVSVLSLVFATTTVTTVAHAQSYILKTLATFNGTDQGAHPNGTLIMDREGNLYGTTSNGGESGGGGTVFKIDVATNSLTTIANFKTTSGWEPSGALALDSKGELYGTTLHGGASPGFGAQEDGMGTVYKVDVATHKLTTIASLSQIQGSFPEGLTLDQSGNLYGITTANAMGPSLLYRISTKTNTITALNVFDDLDGGATPGGVMDSQGNLYGAIPTGKGGPSGRVFMVKAGTKTPITYATFSKENGITPNGSLAIDSHGNLYGTTKRGGENHCGTVFKIEADTKRIVTLASFHERNGWLSDTSVTVDSLGNVYGTTQGGRKSGTVFMIAAGTSTMVTIAEFNGTNGASPEAGLTVDGKGNLYGTTRKGGPGDNGTVFMLIPRNAQ